MTENEHAFCSVLTICVCVCASARPPRPRLGIIKGIIVFPILVPSLGLTSTTSYNVEAESDTHGHRPHESFSGRKCACTENKLQPVFRRQAKTLFLARGV